MFANTKSVLLKYNIALLLCIALAFVVFFLKSKTNIHTPLSWDEVHYGSLANKGILYNALEENSLNFIEFYKIGKARADKDTLLNAQLVKKYNYPDENLNPFYLRHYHPPLATYYWSFFINENDIIQNDKNLRYSNIVLGAFAIVALFLALYIAKQLNYKVVFFIAVVSSILLVSTIFNYSFETLNFHTFQFIFSVLFLGFLIRWLNTNSKKNALLLGVSVALMFLALETALFIVGAALLGLLLAKKIKLFFKQWYIVLGSFLLTMIVLWPGIVRTLSPVKTWIMYFARIFLKGNDEYSGVKMSQVWLEMFSENMVLFSVLLLFFLGGLLLSIKYSKTKNYIVLYTISFIYLLSITPFILNRTYVFPAIGLFIVTIIYSFFKLDYSKIRWINQSFFAMYRYLIVSFFILGYVILKLVNVDYKEELASNIEHRKEFDFELNQIKELVSDKQNIIAFNGQLFRYYINRPDIVDMRKNQMVNSGFYIREKGMYVDVTQQIKQQEIGAILFHESGLKRYNSQKTEWLEDIGYKKNDLKHFRIFLSPKNIGY